MLIVMASVDGDSPPSIEACRAGDWPTAAEYTFPMYVDVIMEVGTLDLEIAARIAVAPSSGAETLARAPLNCRNDLSESSQVGRLLRAAGGSHTFPVGVRAALRIYASLISCFENGVECKCRRICANRRFEEFDELLEAICLVIRGMRADMMTNRKARMRRTSKDGTARTCVLKIMSHRRMLSSPQKESRCSVA